MRALNINYVSIIYCARRSSWTYAESIRVRDSTLAINDERTSFCCAPHPTNRAEYIVSETQNIYVILHAKNGHLFGGGNKMRAHHTAYIHIFAKPSYRQQLDNINGWKSRARARSDARQNRINMQRRTIEGLLYTLRSETLNCILCF